MPIRVLFGNWISFIRMCGYSEPLKWIPSEKGITRKGRRNKKRKKIINHCGYIEIFEPKHPMARKNGYVFEHRMIAYDNNLLKDFTKEIHHINGVKTDNRIENLKILLKSKHTRHHHKGVKQSRKNNRTCWYKDCNNLTASKYGLCRKHYKIQWQRKRDGLIKTIYEHFN